VTEAEAPLVDVFTIVKISDRCPPALARCCCVRERRRLCRIPIQTKRGELREGLVDERLVAARDPQCAERERLGVRPALQKGWSFLLEALSVTQCGETIEPRGGQTK
jgi:hypothetical protein